MKKQILNQSVSLLGNKLSCEGKLVKDTIPNIWEKVQSLLPSNQDIIVDLENVTQADSASLSLLLQIMRFAQNKKTNITFTNIPKQMEDLAKVNGLVSFIPVVK